MGDNNARAVLLTADEAAPMLGVASSTICTWFKRGKIGGHGWRYAPGRKPSRLFAWGELLDTEEKSRLAGYLTVAG